MNKKIISFVTAFFMIFTLFDFPAAVYAADSFGFTIDGDTLTNYYGNGGDVVVPDGVKHIAYIAFVNDTDVTSVTLPEGIETIGESAFNGCRNMMSINLPDSITSIGKSAFGNCGSLTEITIPAGVTSIEPFAFDNCRSLQKVTIHSNVGSIGDYAFRQCLALTHIDIPSSVKSIGEKAFVQCPMTSITIPESVETIGTRVFMWCDELKTVIYPDSLNIDNADVPAEAAKIAYHTNSDGGVTVTNIQLAGGETEVQLPETINGARVTSVDESVRDKVSPVGHAHRIEKDADCTSGDVCSICGEINAPLGHSFTNYVSDGNATCTADGTKTAKCDRCDETDTIEDTGSKLEHSETEIPAVDPTCTLSGATAGVKCSVCGEILTAPEEIPPLGHSFENGECTVCGAKDPDYSQPTETTPDDTEPPVTNPSDTEPPVTAPPVTNPSDTEPPVTVPPVTDSSDTEPPVTVPPVTAPAETAPSNGYPLVIPYGYTASSNEKIFEALAGASDGDTVVIDLNGNTDVDKSVFDEIKGRDVTVRFRLKRGAYWTINGKDIEQSRKIDLGVRMNRMSAPRDEIKELAGDKKTVKFTLSHNGKLGISGILNVPINEKYNGKYANLYYYSKGFEFVGSSLISDGYAQFRFDHASEYIIVIDDYPHGEDISAAAGAQCDDTPIDGSGHEDSGKAPAYFTDENKIRITNGKRRYRILKAEH